MTDGQDLRYGLIGRNIGYSFSPRIHGMLGCSSYDLISLEPEALAEFLNTTDLDGLNVTTPYKRAVMPLCAAVDPVARAAGAVNTLCRCADGWHGCNTDVIGFRVLLAAGGFGPDGDFPLAGKHVLILGTGGAAAAVACTVCEEAPATITFCSRDPESLDPAVRTSLLTGPAALCDYDHLPETVDLVINATPLGTVPDLDKSPLDLTQLPGCKAAIDLVYRPFRTRFLLQAKELGMKTANGLVMLTAQAIASAELFRTKGPGRMADRPALTDLIARTTGLAGQLESKTRNIVLVGMPGAGKTSLARQLAKELGRPFADSDQLIREQTGRTPQEILTGDGETAFRDIEEEVIQEMACREGWVYSTGGGIAEREDNLRRLRQTGFLIHIHKDLSSLATRNRPLSQDPETLAALFERRNPLYKKAADITLTNDRSFHKTLAAIQRSL